MAEITGIKSVERSLKKLEKARLEASATGKVEATVGYTAAYAAYVHEIPAKHKKGKQDKFLEQPARELANNGTLRDIIVEAANKGASLQKAVTLAARRLQRESMKLVPVDTGNLKSSAFVREA